MDDLVTVQKSGVGSCVLLGGAFPHARSMVGCCLVQGCGWVLAGKESRGFLSGGEVRSRKHGVFTNGVTGLECRRG